jgi:hypothetical protein
MGAEELSKRRFELARLPLLATALALALLAYGLAGCQRSPTKDSGSAHSRATLELGGYSILGLADWSEITSETKRAMEDQAAALNASLSLRSRFLRAYRGRKGEVYTFSILEYPQGALGAQMVDGYLDELSRKFKGKLAGSDPQSASTTAANGKLWSWHVAISDQLLYKTIYLDDLRSDAVEIDLMADKSMPRESFDSYIALCASLK